MLYLSFSNYSDFRQLFPCRTYDGRTSRDNKVLLSLLKQRWILHDPLSKIRTMSEMEQALLERIQSESTGDNIMSLAGMQFRSSEYRTDDRNGICDDDDAEQVRVIKREPDGNGGLRDKVYKNKAGKLFRKIVVSTPVGQRLPEEVINYMCEVFKLRWYAHSQQIIHGYTLHVDDNFRDLYTQSRLDGNFHSCMVGGNRSDFYRKSVQAKAAYITNRDGKIKARAIIYTNAIDEDGRVWRLCERQYASGLNESLKRTLVNLLIAGGYIDGYKQVGAGCGDSRSFVDNQGRSLSNKRFKIKCTLDCDDVLSYQDSFKWYNIKQGFSYNYVVSPSANLGSTSSRMSAPSGTTRRYDQYHNRNTFHSLVPVLVHGNPSTCSEASLEDFTRAWVSTRSQEMYVYNDDVAVCPDCGSAYVSEMAFHSDILNRDFCCADCRARAERAYREGHCAFVEDTNAWVVKSDAFYSTLIDAYYSTELALAEAELRFKADNWDWCEDVKTYVDPDTTFWSRRTRKFYSTPEAKQEAELSLAA